MVWQRSDVIALARVSCTICHGYGMRLARGATEAPCDCVFRAIFRTCYRRFRECVALGSQTGTVVLDFCGGPGGHRMYARKKEEYTADFCLVSRRALDGIELKVFRYHYLLGADWRLCSRQLKIDRGDFFHLLYRIEGKLGEVFAELEPYPLFPIDEYFGGAIRREPQFAQRAFDNEFDDYEADEAEDYLAITA
jgi:hypothetical protein